MMVPYYFLSPSCAGSSPIPTACATLRLEECGGRDGFTRVLRRDFGRLMAFGHAAEMTVSRLRRRLALRKRQIHPDGEHGCTTDMRYPFPTPRELFG